uniref:Uncharacterized protein n=1 Tax=Panagrolaimus davidi TaxID=227884 RepID=A0A914R4T0_9BILA
MAMPAFGGNGLSTLPPPFGAPGGIGSFQGVPPQMNPMFQQQQQPGFPQMNQPPPFPMNNQGPQMGQLAGFTNGFADMLGMSPPPPMQGFPGSPPAEFNLIDSATSPPLNLKKRQISPQNGMNGQFGSFGQSGTFGQPGQQGPIGQQQQMNGGGQQRLGPAGIPIVGNVQGSPQNPSLSQPFGSFQTGIGANSMQPQQQQ